MVNIMYSLLHCYSLH